MRSHETWCEMKGGAITGYIIINFIIIGILFLAKTDLFFYIQNDLFKLILYFFIIFTAIILWFCCANSDPGYSLQYKSIPLSQKINKNSNSESNITVIEESEETRLLSESHKKECDNQDNPNITTNNQNQNNNQNNNWCNSCCINKPPRTKHCYICHRCVYKFDHHCPFTANCIGGKNHRIFWWYLLIQFISLIWSSYMVVTSFSIPSSSFQMILRMLLVVGLLLCLINNGSLLGFHTFLMCTNRTTYETIKDLPNFYFMGYFLNTLSFCKAQLDKSWTVNMIENQEPLPI